MCHKLWIESNVMKLLWFGFFWGVFFFSTLMASKAVNGFWVFFATTGDCFL